MLVTLLLSYLCILNLICDTISFLARRNCSGQCCIKDQVKAHFLHIVTQATTTADIAPNQKKQAQSQYQLVSKWCAMIKFICKICGNDRKIISMF